MANITVKIEGIEELTKALIYCGSVIQEAYAVKVNDDPKEEKPKVEKVKKEETNTEKPKAEKLKAEKLKAEETKTEQIEETETDGLTLEDVRKELAAISKQGKKAEVKALLTKYGADTLSDLDAEHYKAILEEARGV